MKKLLIKVVCLLAAVSMAFGLCVGCDDTPSGDITETMGVILWSDSTPDQTTPDQATPDQPTVAPTVKPTETTTPTEPKPAETSAPTAAPVYDDTDDYDQWSPYDNGEDYSGESYDDSSSTSYDYDDYDNDEDDYDYSDNTSSTGSPRLYEPSDFLMRGVINWGGWTWTYYSENILPGDGLYLPGRHADSDGYICDGDGYICLASSSLAWGTVVDTPFGRQGKVYDSGCASHILDVYTNW